MKTINIQLNYSDIQQGIVEKKAYISGSIAYIKTKSGKETWFDQEGHVIRQISKNGEELREYYNTGVIKRLCKVGKYEVFYNSKGLKTHKIKNNGIEEFWEYDNAGHLYRWFNTIEHERKYSCDDTGKIVAWYCNDQLLNWYKNTGRKLDPCFVGLIEI